MLFQHACQESLNPAIHRANLDEALVTYSGDPLWPALARHVARRSTSDDRALLIDLIQHPEKREPPLSWGLKYYLRGDIVLEDGREVLLDDACEQLGLPRLPYLEDLPPELDVDWEKES